MQGRENSLLINKFNNHENFATPEKCVYVKKE
jgi:hypothetical protein